MTELIRSIFILICVAFVVERTTEIIVDSKLFAPLRNYLATKAVPDNLVKPWFIWTFLYNVISCGYCLSVWVAAFYTYFSRLDLCDDKYSNYLVNAILLHGLSNIFHVLYMKIYRGQVKYLHLTLKEDKEDGL